MITKIVNISAISSNNSETTCYIERVGDIKMPCQHPEHYPPNCISLPPGVYRNTCPACGHVTEWMVGGAFS